MVIVKGRNANKNEREWEHTSANEHIAIIAALSRVIKICVFSRRGSR
jgi:hypothetical protein